MRLGIFGNGRLGSAIAEVAADRGMEPVWVVGRHQAPPEAVDVAIDASVAAAVPHHLDWALDEGVSLVIGVTGWQMPDLEARVDDRIGVLVAPNFSLAVALMVRLSEVLGRFAALDDQLDLFVQDHHHRAKTDSPSGTARRLAAALMAGCPRKTRWTTSPDAAIAEDELSIGVVRSGDEPGSHIVGVDSPWDLLQLSHRARGRETFAIGALHAARWLSKRRGVFHFDDFAAQTLNPLFRFGESP